MSKMKEIHTELLLTVENYTRFITNAVERGDLASAALDAESLRREINRTRKLVGA
jgi:hypothetical protein